MSCDSQIKCKDKKKKHQEKKTTKQQKYQRNILIFILTAFALYSFLSQGEGCILVTLPRVLPTVPTVLLIHLPNTSPVDG